MKMLRNLIALSGVMLVAACGSTPASTTPGASFAAPTATATAAVTAEPPASLPAGTIRYRVVNLHTDESGSAAAVDVYARTQGLVEAAPVRLGLPYGEATDYFSPPEPGTVVVTSAGAGDPTCVIDCPHFINESSTSFGEGDARTIILYGDGGLELWHNPEPATVGTTGNALAPADPSAALLFVVAVAVHEADFGLHLGFDGVAGCQVNRTSEGVLVGGNQVGLFAFPSPADVLLYDTRDPECAQEPVGGPFTVSGEPGSRRLLVLSGAPSEMDALNLDL